MKYQQSLETIKKSLYSHDPQTGELIKNFPTNIEKSLETLINPSIDDLKMMLNKKCGYPLRRGFTWLKEEDKSLTAAYERGDKIYEIAKNHQRSKIAVLSRLKYLNLINREVELPKFKNKERFSIYI